MRVPVLSLVALLPAVAVAQDDSFFTPATGLIENLPDANVEASGNDAVAQGTEAELSNLLITGWYSDCSREFECLGDYRPNTGTPGPIDVTGNTCYVNPAKDKKDAVIWYAKLPYAGGTPLEDQVFSWTITLREEDATDVMPGPCNADGACECGNFTSVRAGWDTITSKEDFEGLCEYPATTCSFFHTLVYSPVDCNVNYWVEVTVNGVLSRTCVTAASLEEVPQPTATPTAAPPTDTPGPPTTMAPTTTPGEVMSCVDIDTPQFQGDVTSAETCIAACGANQAASATWDRIDGTLQDGRDFDAWRCICDQTTYCSSVEIDDEVTGPPSEPPSCFNLKITNIGNCGFACDVIHPDKVRVNFTSEENDQGDTYYECQCVFADDSAETICMGTEVATAAPTSSPTISMEPSQSMMPTRGIKFYYPSAAPTTSTIGGPSTTTQSDTPSAGYAISVSSILMAVVTLVSVMAM